MLSPPNPVLGTQLGNHQSSQYFISFVPTSAAPCLRLSR